jgi:hypothetical protein
MLKKLYAILFGIATIFTALFIANKRGKKEGKEEQISKQNKKTLDDVKETQEIQAKNRKLTKSQLFTGLSD